MDLLQWINGLNINIILFQTQQFTFKFCVDNVLIEDSMLKLEIKFC